MSKAHSEEMLDMLARIDRLPPEALGHVLARGLREYDRLKSKMLIGKNPTPPIIWQIMIVIGDHTPKPAYVIYPAMESAEDFHISDLIKKTLEKERLELFDVEKLEPLRGSGLSTAAIALFGNDQNGDPVLDIAHHPSLTMGQGVCVLLAALLGNDKKHRSGKA